MAVLRRSLLVVALMVGLLLLSVGGVEQEVMGGYDARRSLAGSPYYISYGTLNANRAPCPSGQGRSYYTQSCQPSGGNADPYARSCTQIARCARG